MTKVVFVLCYLCALLALLPGCRHQMAALQTAEGVEFREGGKRILFYRTRPLKMEDQYERAGYVHPLYDLNGNVMTEDGPADHPYHRGIFWAWHQVASRGVLVADGWMSEGVAFVPLSVKYGAGRGSTFLSARMLWRATAAPRDLLREHVIIRAYPAKKGYRIVDFDISLVPLTDSLALGGADDVKGYGGFCLRLLLPPDISFWSGGQEVEARETAVAAGPWMDFSGSYEDARRGLTVFCHPGNTGASQNWILRKRKSMQNVVFPGRHPKMLPPQGWRMRYRLIVHNGEVTKEVLEELYRLYNKR